MKTYRDHAIVLRKFDAKEKDRVVVLLTEHHGKVRTIAYRVRSAKNSNAGRLEPLNIVDVLLKEGRDLDTIQDVRLVEGFRTIRTNLAPLSQALAMIEAVDRLTPDKVAVDDIYTMLTRALLELNERPSPLVAGAFFWKLLAYEGQSPQVDSCVRCGTSTDIVSFSVIDGGVHCDDCRSGVSLSPAGLALLRQILGGQLAAALAEPDSPAVQEVHQLAKDAMEAHLERSLRSLGVLDRHL